MNFPEIDEFYALFGTRLGPDGGHGGALWSAPSPLPHYPGTYPPLHHRAGHTADLRPQTWRVHQAPLGNNTTPENMFILKWS